MILLIFAAIYSGYAWWMMLRAALFQLWWAGAVHGLIFLALAAMLLGTIMVVSELFALGLLLVAGSYIVMMAEPKAGRQMKELVSRLGDDAMQR